MNKVLLAGIFLLSFVPGISQKKEKEYSEMLSLIDLWLDAQRDFDRLPGLSVSIVHDQEVIFKKGYGYADLVTLAPMKPEAVFSICSITKLFTSIAIMQLWEKGIIGLQEPPDRLLPSFKIKQQFASSAPITIHSMLTHSSGIPRDADSSWNGPDFYFLNKDELKKSLLQKETLFPAGLYYQYSNIGMSLLGEIIAVKTGKTYTKYIEENILSPLQMNDTRPYQPDLYINENMAVGYSALYRDGKRNPQSSFNTNSITPAAGLYSTVLDMAKFASWQLRLLHKEQQQVLKSSTLKEMQRIQWISPDKKITRGLGFNIIYDATGSQLIGHDGGCPGYTSIIMIDPKSNLGVSIMINAQGVDLNKYCNQIFALLNRKIPGDDLKEANTDLNVYKGRYDDYAWSGETGIVPVNGRLVMFNLNTSTPSTNLKEFRYVAKDRFRRIRPEDGSLAEELIFDRDEQGNITRLKLNSSYQKRIN